MSAISVFLQPQSLTIPTENHDYPEWHKGRSHYALWYIEIDHPELLQYLYHLRQQFAPYLYQPNTRQFHITLFICGFLIENSLSNTKISQFNDDFSYSQMQQQRERINASALTSFRLKTGKINSFDSALFIEIEDIENSLSKIRTQFSNHQSEIAPLNYCPHITIGLYSREFEAHQVFRKIESIEQQSFEISVNHLTFGTYQAKVLQGELSALEHFQLERLKRRESLNLSKVF